MTCPLCNKAKPGQLIQEHHKIPRAAGGESGSTIFICTECHTALHLCATKILAGKGSEAQQVAQNIFQNKAEAKRLIVSIVKNTLRKREGYIPDEQLEYKVTLVFPGAIRRCFEILSKDNKVSINKVVESIVIDYIRKKFPNFKL